MEKKSAERCTKESKSVIKIKIENRMSKESSLRDILSSTILKLHPSTQPLKERALEKIILQIYLYLNKECLSVDEIQKELGKRYNIHFGIKDIEKILKISEINFYEYESKWYIPEEFIEKVETRQRDALSTYKKVIKSLFGKDVDTDRYMLAFFDFLSSIFITLSGNYVEQLIGKNETTHFVSYKYFNEKLKTILEKYPEIDEKLFERGVRKFFTEIDPEYDSIKWNMVQNYYLLKVLGLDPTGYILSEEKLKGAIFYLDTNILISLIFESNRHHKSTEFLLKSSNRLKIDIKITKITMDEFKEWINYKISTLEKVYDRIPDKMENEVSSQIYKEYKKYLSNNGSGNFSRFREYIIEKIRTELKNIRILDDEWFDEEENSEETKRLSEKLKDRYDENGKRQKSELASIHDALLLRWIDKERKSINRNNIWLITLDNSLPGALYNRMASLSITLDSLLQFVSPFVDIPDAQTVFSELIKTRFFPEEKLFDINDFLIFHELDIKTKELPIEDVEDAIRDLKSRFFNIEPSTPNALQNLSYALARFFVNPERKYQKLVQEHEENEKKLIEKYESKLGKLQNLIQKYELGQKKLENKYEIKIREKDERLSQLEKRIEQMEKEKKHDKLLSSAKKRLKITLGVWLSIFFIIIILNDIYGTGNNFYQKFLNGSPIIILWLSFISILGWIIIGKERLIALGWPFNKIFHT